MLGSLTLLIAIVTGALAATLPEGADSQIYHVCSAHSPDYLGSYEFNEFQDGVSAYINDDGMGLWRHKGFWYMGDYSTWPPQTQWRCISNCEEGRGTPPLTGYMPKR